MSKTLTAEENLVEEFYQCIKDIVDVNTALYYSESCAKIAEAYHKAKVESITDEWIENNGKEGGLMHSERQGVAGELQIFIEGGQAVKRKLLEQ